MSTPLTLQAQAALLHLREGGHLETPVSIPDTVVPLDDQPVVHHDLADVGYIEDGEATAGGQSLDFCLTTRGAQAAQTMTNSYKRQMWKHHILALAEAGKNLTLTDLMDDPRCPKADYEVVREQVDELEKAGLVAGTHTGSGLMSPRLTSKGQDCFDSGYGPEDFAKTPHLTTSRTSINNSVNVSNSPGSAISTSIGNATSANHTITLTSPGSLDLLVANLDSLAAKDDQATANFHETVERIRQEPQGVTRATIASLIAVAYLGWGPASLPIITTFANTLDG